MILFCHIQRYVINESVEYRNYLRSIQEVTKGNLYNTKHRPNSSRFSGRPAKPHVTTVPEMLPVEREAL
jgi:hypothetical protein